MGLMTITSGFPHYYKAMEDFPTLGIPNVHGLIQDSKPYLVVKIIDI
jgi:hypothetical protein